MDWDAIGAVGEILGAFAVVGSLVYLGSQIRVQNREARVASVHEASEAYRTSIAVLQDPEMADLHIRALSNFDDFTPAERLRYIVFLLGIFKVWEEAYYQWREDRMDQEAWESMLAPLADVMSTDGPRKVWELRKHQFRKDFADYIDTVETGKYRI
jgi:hypothetical protein